MEKFTGVEGVAAPLNRVNVDTDQIVPKQFLKRVERSGFGRFLFFDWRYLQDGETPNPEFPLNRPEYAGASILLAGKNFGCGSSREHAPWALQDYGFRVIIAPSFADIFFNNCFQIGLLPVALPEEELDPLIRRAEAGPLRLNVDLRAETISDDAGVVARFHVDPFRRKCLLNGLDDIGLTLQHEGDIAAFEARRPAWRPAVSPTGA